jgi:hypothetical protein
MKLKTLNIQGTSVSHNKLLNSEDFNPMFEANYLVVTPMSNLKNKCLSISCSSNSGSNYGSRKESSKSVTQFDGISSLLLNQIAFEV